MQFLIPSVDPLFTYNIVCLWSDIDFPYFELAYCFQALAIQFSTVNWTHGVFAKQGYWRQFLNFRMWRYHKSLCRCQENSEKPHVANVFFHLFVTSNQWIICPFANTQLQSKMCLFSSRTLLFELWFVWPDHREWIYYLFTDEIEFPILVISLQKQNFPSLG